MSLLSHHTQVRFATEFPLDKIVQIFTGSFNENTDTTSLTYTFATLPLKAWYYVVPHHLGRPVYAELLTSPDGQAYNNTQNIALSDSNNCYIFVGTGPTPPPSATVYYKLVCSWINKFDNTNPAITPFVPKQSRVYFDSRANYQKILLQDVATLSTASPSVTIAHNLGYQPNVKVFMETFPGFFSPLHPGGADDPFKYDDNQIVGYCLTTNSGVTITSSAGPNPYSGRFFYRIYLDT